jgi:hypothetical protein
VLATAGRGSGSRRTSVRPTTGLLRESPLQPRQHRRWHTTKHARRREFSNWAHTPAAGDAGELRGVADAKPAHAAATAPNPELTFYHVGRELNNLEPNVTRLPAASAADLLARAARSSQIRLLRTVCAGAAPTAASSTPAATAANDSPCVSACRLAGCRVRGQRDATLSCRRVGSTPSDLDCALRRTEQPGCNRDRVVTRSISESARIGPNGRSPARRASVCSPPGDQDERSTST